MARTGEIRLKISLNLRVRECKNIGSLLGTAISDNYMINKGRNMWSTLSVYFFYFLDRRQVDFPFKSKWINIDINRKTKILIFLYFLYLLTLFCCILQLVTLFLSYRESFYMSMIKFMEQNFNSLLSEVNYLVFIWDW